MKITIKRLEIIFLIVYFLTAFVCFLIGVEFGCLEGSLAGFGVSLFDWYLLKLMAKRWLRRGRYSIFDSMIRFFIVGVSIWGLLNINLDVIGLVLGLSVIPFSIVVLSVFNLLSKKITL